jgi:flagellar biosynthesis component FlhA
VRVTPDAELPEGVAWRALLDGRPVLARPAPIGGDALALLVEDAEAVVVNRPEPFLTIQRVHDRLDELTHTQPALVGALVPARFDHGTLTEILRHLVRAGLRLEPFPAVLDAIASTRAQPGPVEARRVAEEVKQLMERRYELG